MTDGQYFVYVIAAPETGGILGAWWLWRRIQRRRARTEWIRQLEARRRRARRAA